MRPSQKQIFYHSADEHVVFFLLNLNNVPVWLPVPSLYLYTVPYLQALLFYLFFVLVPDGHVLYPFRVHGLDHDLCLDGALCHDL